MFAGDRKPPPSKLDAMAMRPPSEPALGRHARIANLSYLERTKHVQFPIFFAILYWFVTRANWQPGQERPIYQADMIRVQKPTALWIKGPTGVPQKQRGLGFAYPSPRKMARPAGFEPTTPCFVVGLEFRYWLRLRPLDNSE